MEPDRRANKQIHPSLPVGGVAGGLLDAPSVKPRLAALRHLFDWLVNGQVVPVNPAHTVRGLRHVVRGGKTPVTDGAAGRRPPGI